MNRRIILWLLVLLPALANAQKQGQELIDSLLQALPKQHEDTMKAKVLYRLSGCYFTVDVDKGFLYGRMGLALSHKLKWQPGLEKSYNSLGLNYWAKGDLDTAILYFDTVITISRQNGDKIMENKGMLNTGSCYNIKGYYPKALEYYMKCLKIEENMGDKQDEALCLNNIASAYFKTENFKEALNYGQQSFALFSQLDNKNGMARSITLIGDCLDAKGDEKNALASYQKSLELYNLLQDRNGASSSLNEMGLLYEKLGDYQAGITTCEHALAIADSLGNEYLEGLMCDDVATIYLDAVITGKTLPRKAYESANVFEGKPAYLLRAGNYLDRALKINEKQKDFDAFRECYRRISTLDSLRGDFQGALAAYKEYTVYKDSVFNSNNKQTIQQLEDQRQIDLRDKEIQINNLRLSNDERQRWVYVVGIIFLFIIGVLLFLRSRQRQKANAKLQSVNTKLDEANKVKTRFFAILSHDLRSPVASLVNYLYLQKEAPDLIATSPAKQQQQVANYASGLLNVMEDLLLWSKGQMDNFRPEMRTLDIKELFTEMAAIYTGIDGLTVNFIQPAGPLTLTTDANYLKAIIRNFTSNAIKVLKDKPNGLVEWKAWINDNSICLSISDNGPGISPTQQQALFSNDASIGTRNGLGLHLIRDLAQALHCTIAVDSTMGKGTTFTLTMPQS